MNRQQRRVIHKLTGAELKAKEQEAILKGVKGTMAIFAQVMSDDFGYGDVRLKRIEDAVRVKMGLEVD